MNFFSFDVFDTCLCRLCGGSRNLFEVLSLRVQELMGRNFTEHMRQLFVATRINCNGRNLIEIYQQMASSFPLPCSVEEMAQMEMDVERDMLVPIVATRKLVEQLRQKGDILFISDMYLPDEFIREQLIHHGFFQDGDCLYVSETVGARKHDGTLFQLVHDREGVPYRKWSHYGDSRLSDYKVPRRFGIHAHYLNYDYSYYEKQWLQQPVLGFQYASIFAGISRAVRLQSESFEAQARFVADISAPFMVAWIIGVLQDAQQRGIRRLYFLARDVHSEYLIAKRLRLLFPEIEVRYLFVSRKSLYESDLAADYLRQEGLADDTPMAIVDSNTSGKTLKAMNELVGRPSENAIHGYFILKNDMLELRHSLAGDYLLNSYYLDAFVPKKVSRALGMRIFFELLFSVNFHLTTIGYECRGKTIRPVFGENSEDNWCFDNMTHHLAKRNNDMVLLSYVDAIELTGLVSFADTIMGRLVLPTMVEFVDRPRKEYLDYFQHFILWERPFVGKKHGAHKGIWKRGNRAFVFPVWTNLIKMVEKLFNSF